MVSGRSFVFPKQVETDAGQLSELFAVAYYEGIVLSFGSPSVDTVSPGEKMVSSSLSLCLSRSVSVSVSPSLSYSPPLLPSPPVCECVSALVLFSKRGFCRWEWRGGGVAVVFPRTLTRKSFINNHGGHL